MPLDEKTLPAIHITEPAVAGWIFAVVVYDVTTGEDFIYSEKSGRNQLPVEIPYDHLISISASAENTGDAEQRMVLTVELIDPDGIVRDSVSADATPGPGVIFTSGRTANFMPDKSGTWSIHAILEAELV